MTTADTLVVDKVQMDPSLFRELKSEASRPLETLLPMSTLVQLKEHSEVRRELDRRALKYDRDVEDLIKYASAPKTAGFQEEFIDRATALYDLHGLGKKSSVIGNALVNAVLIPVLNEHNIKRLCWTEQEVQKYHGQYAAHHKGAVELGLEDFELSHPLDKVKVKNLQMLEIRGQPGLDHVSSDFIGSELKSFIVSNCSLASLPAEGFARCKSLTHVDISGNPELTETEINKALKAAATSIRSLDLSGIKLNRIPSAVSKMKSLTSLKMDNCNLISVSSTDLPQTLTEFSCKNHCGTLPTAGVLSHLEKLDISSTKTVSADEFTRWVQKAPRRSSPVQELTYSRTPSTRFTAEQKQIIMDALPNLVEGGLKNVVV